MPEAHNRASGTASAICAALLVAAVPCSLTAQAAAAPVARDYSITISVVSTAGARLGYSTVAVVEAGIERFTNQRGEFFVSGLAPGSYSVRVKQLGFIASEIVVALTGEQKSVALQIRLAPIPFILDRVVVSAIGKCPEATDLSDTTNSTLALIFGEVSKNADRLRLLQERYPFTYTLSREFMTYDRFLGPRDPLRDTVMYASTATWKYAPGEVVQHDSINGPGEQVMKLPQLADLADSTFQSTHCFYYRGPGFGEGNRQHRIDFIPLSHLDVPDVEGSVYIDSRNYVLTSAVFRLTQGEKLKPPVQELEVETVYREIFQNIVIFSEITAKQPYVDRRGRNRYAELRQRQRLLNYRFLRGKPGDTISFARVDSLMNARAARDSIQATFGWITGTIINPGRKPVAGALIGMEDARLNVTTDVAGQFAVRGVLPGEQELVISAEGYEPLRIQVDVVAGKVVTLPLILYPNPPP